MITSCKLGGFLTAHAIWSVSDRYADPDARLADRRRFSAKWIGSLANVAMQSFFSVVDEPEQGARIWSECLDESR